MSGASSTAPMAIKPKVTSPRAAPVMEVGLEEGIGMGTMEEEECRGKADNSPAAAPLQPKALHLCPSRPANRGTDNRRKGSGKETAPTSGNPKARKKEPPPPPPPHPSEALTTTSTRGGRGALPVRPATRKGAASRGTPEGQPAT